MRGHAEGDVVPTEDGRAINLSALLFRAGGREEKNRVWSAPHMIATGRQLRAARVLLGWTRVDLARASGVHANSVAYWEATANIPTGPYHEPIACRRMRAALLAAGVRTKVSPSIGVELCGRDNSDTSTRARARPRHGVKRSVVPGHAAPVRPNKPARPSRAEPRLCRARTRRGDPCQRTALPNGRCANHGGKSTGPRTRQGRERIAAVQRRRWREWRRAAAARASRTG
jgi:DNA-binding transcriptional regulator YiaG